MTGSAEGAGERSVEGRREAIRLPRDVSVTETADGAVLLDQRNGRYWQLNSTGATTLRLLLEGCSAEEIARRITERCPLEEARAAGDVRRLVGQLRAAKLVVPG